MCVCLSTNSPQWERAIQKWLVPVLLWHIIKKLTSPCSGAGVVGFFTTRSMFYDSVGCGRLGDWEVARKKSFFTSNSCMWGAELFTVVNWMPANHYLCGSVCGACFSQYQKSVTDSCQDSEISNFNSISWPLKWSPLSTLVPPRESEGSSKYQEFFTKPAEAMQLVHTNLGSIWLSFSRCLFI